MKLLLCVLALFAAACSSTPTQPAAKQSTASARFVSPCEAYTSRPTPRSFTDFDADGNGNVMPNEFLCQEVKRFDELDKDDDDFLSASELAASNGFETKDQNGDGQLSVIEYMWAAETALVKADESGDAALSADEYAKGFH